MTSSAQPVQDLLRQLTQQTVSIRAVLDYIGERLEDEERDSNAVLEEVERRLGHLLRPQVEAEAEAEYEAEVIAEARSWAAVDATLEPEPEPEPGWTGGPHSSAAAMLAEPIEQLEHRAQAMTTGAEHDAADGHMADHANGRHFRSVSGCPWCQLEAHS